MEKTYDEILQEAIRYLGSDKSIPLEDDGNRATAKIQVDNISWTHNKGYTIYRTRFHERATAEDYVSTLDLLAPAYEKQDPDFQQASKITVL